MSTVGQHVGAVKIPKTGNAFLDSVAADAIESQRATGVPASVTLAQAILESGWGKSGLATKHHNYFGIKGKGTVGTAVMTTWEHENGQDVVIKDGFRVYRSAAESFKDHGLFFIVNKRYAEAMRHTDDAERFAKEIHKAGYATDPNYSQTLIKLIRQYKLTNFDQVARTQSGPLPSSSSQTSQTTSSSAGSSRKPSAEAVKDLQQLLVKYGYMTDKQMQTGPGILGPQTQAAVDQLVKQKAGIVSSVSTGSGAVGGSGGSTVIPAKTTSGVPSYEQISKDFKAKITGSKYFTWHEALWLPQFNRHASASEVSPTILHNIVRQAKALDVVRDHFKSPIGVHCWLRPPAYNTHIKGAKKSAHLRGTATDFHIVGYTADHVRKVLQTNKALYPGAGELLVTWVHLDLEHKTWFYP
ncbi:MAG TPA: glucosaminidase domain-containing protein [Archangium sp.]|jgi:uncharacterized protein YcbK (DUF882 family)|uniref:glucosaminidase domain-containing protein n=1 Tax=Archangium sp. TaxID=1872627 RepID=UPI002ED9504D